MSFVDVRLHISVRPTLEYTLPEMSKTIKSCLLGDMAVAHVLPALEACRGMHENSPPSAEEGLSAETFAPNAEPMRLIQTCMAETLTILHDYLLDLAMLWRRHLTTTHAHVTRIVHEVDDEQTAARCDKENYRGEIQRIRTHLDAALQRLRDAEEPHLARPEALTTACDRLRTVFANAYGTVPTTELIAVKRHFEERILCTQATISKDFLSFCTKLVVAE